MRARDKRRRQRRRRARAIERQANKNAAGCKGIARFVQLTGRQERIAQPTLTWNKWKGCSPSTGAPMLANPIPRNKAAGLIFYPNGGRSDAQVYAEGQALGRMQLDYSDVIIERPPLSDRLAAAWVTGDQARYAGLCSAAARKQKAKNREKLDYFHEGVRRAKLKREGKA